MTLSAVALRTIAARGARKGLVDFAIGAGLLNINIMRATSSSLPRRMTEPLGRALPRHHYQKRPPFAVLLAARCNKMLDLPVPLSPERRTSVVSGECQT